MIKKRKIIDENGNLIIGIIKDKEIDFNYKKYKLLNFFDKEIKGIKKRFKFHHFNYYAIFSKKFILAFAIVDLGYIKTMFLYLYDYKNDFLVKKELKFNAFSRKLNFPVNPDIYKIKYHNKNDFLKIEKDFFNNLLLIKGEFENLKFDLDINYGRMNFPLKIVIPAGHNGWTFTEKCSNINDFNKISIKFKNNELDFNNASLVYDWSGGYLKRETNWIWASFSGLNKDKKLIGANFAAMVNETYETENIYWIDKRPTKEDLVIFKYDSNNLYNVWEIQNKSKTVSVKFYPKNEINDKTNAFFVKNLFKQFVGKFSGYIMDKNNNEKIEFDNISGVTELHKALW